MASYIVTVATGIKTHLEGGSYTTTPTFERRWLPYLDRVAIGTATKVVVVPNGTTQEQLSRGQRLHEIVIDAFVQKAIDWETNSEADAVSELAEQINERMHVLPSVAFGSNVVNRARVTFEPFLVGEHLTEYRIFTSRVTSVWKLVS